MNARVFANLTSKELTTRLDGSPFTPARVVQGESIYFYLRVAEEIEDSSVLSEATIAGAAVRFGQIDAAPEQGSYQLTITLGMDEATTASIAHDATPAQVQGAINAALDGVIADLHPCTVTDYAGHYRIVFADNTEAPTIACTDNALWPVSFVDVSTITWDEGNAYLLQLRQTPVAESATISEQVPDAPTITRVQAGSTTDGIAINEIQKLYIPPNFSGGSFQIVRGGIKTDPIPVPVQNGTTTIPARLEPLADEGGEFALTAINNGFYIEFQGTMGGEGQDLMTVSVFEAAPSEWVIRVDTDTEPFRTLMLGADEDGEMEVPFNLRLDLDDPITANLTKPVYFETDWTFRKPVSDDQHNVAADLVWNQPLSRTDNLPHSTDSILVGNRSYVKVIGDGAATSFTINHNLLENPVTVTADDGTDTLTAASHGFQNGDPVTVASSGTVPGGLTAGTTYYVKAATTNTFQLATAPAASAIDLTTAGTGTITVALADGTAADAVFVQVWQTGGSKLLVSPEDYTVGRPSNNSLTVSGFAVTPTSGQYQVVVQTAGRPATYQGHTHTIAEVTGLQAALDALDARVTVLEAMAPGGIPFTAAAGSTGTAISAPLQPVWSVLRSRIEPDDPGTLLGWDPYALETPLRAGRLLPAVHDASTEALPSAPLPTPTASYQGRVFTTGADRADFPGGGLKAGDFAACDGREWYRVIRESGAEDSYYPAPYELELFRTVVNDRMLVTRSTLDLLFGFEVAYFPEVRNPRDRRSAVTWTLKLEIDEWSEDSSPGTPGENLDTLFPSPTIVVEQRLHVTESPQAHRFGLRVTRDGDGDLEVTPVAYRKELATVTAPSSANFAIRARLCRFDTEDTPSDAKGLLAVRGLDVGLDGVADSTLGRLTIT